MLKYILALTCCSFLPFLLTAQPGMNDYAARWKKVDSLVDKKGLPQSALLEVNNIYLLAKKEKNDVQVIKALIYRVNLGEGRQEDAFQKNTADLEKEIAAAEQPARSILQSILAGVYWNYFQSHRYQFYNRTATTGVKSQDPATWGIDDFHKRIGTLYLASIYEEKKLTQTKLEAFDPLIVKGNTRALRSTLFDLLAHRALEYFKTDERDIDRPAYAFEIDDPLAFAEAAIFSSHPFRNADSLSLHFYALQLFQRLIRLHLADTRPDALLDVNTERLEFVWQYGVMEDKEVLFARALTTITERYGAEPGAAQAWYLQAREISNRGSNYDPSDPVDDTLTRTAWIKAKAICEKVIAQKDSSEGKSNCEALLRNILHKELLIQTEVVNLPGQPFRSLVTYRNFSQLYFRLCKTDRTQRESFNANSWKDDYWKKLLQLPAVRNFSQAFPEMHDYRSHKAEIKIDALPPGEYMLIASLNANFELDHNPMAVQYFYVSSIASVNRGPDYFILNRESGQPLAGAAVQVWYRKVDDQLRQLKMTRAETYQVDQHGYFLLKEKAKNERYGLAYLEITTQGDHFFTDEQPNNYYYRNENDEAVAVDRETYEKDNWMTFLFTDRSIYRPGQTVYFKEISVTRDFLTHQSKILPPHTTKVFLFNANEEKIDSLELLTNEFGSCHGKFVLPEHLLNGEFRIEGRSGYGKVFSVEEYKRPKFHVDFERLKATYRVGDSIRVKGTAQAYAGNSIDGAVVKFRVVRQARFPYYLSYWRGRLPVSGQEIAHGEFRTKADGSFDIVFKALPDLSIRKDLDPTFDYRIVADITDINGETRSGSTTVSIGYKVLNLYITFPVGETLPADSLKEVHVGSFNLSGEPVPADVNIRMYKLKAPDRLIRQRYWQQPDQFVLSRDEYLAAFPHDEYRDETKKESWEKEELPSATLRPGKPVDSIGAVNRFALQSAMAPGWYLIEATATDKYGRKVKDLQYIELTNSKTGQPPIPRYSWASRDAQTLEPGNIATFHIGSSAAHLFGIRTLGRKLSPPHQFVFFSLDKEQQRLEIPVSEDDRGGFEVSQIFVKDNRVYTNTWRVNVPWTNKDLSIHYTTWRDKTLPGSEEKWEVKIAGHKGDKVSAEVLAGMYDASLDQFKSHSWDIPGIYPTFSTEAYWDSRKSFEQVQSRERTFNDYFPPSYSKRYDQLIPINSFGRIMIRGMATMSVGRVSAPAPMQEELMSKVSGLQVTADSEGYKKPQYESVTIPSTEIRTNEPAAPIPSDGIRRDFKETAFFFPDLRTDSAGNTAFSFTIPEALTSWKWMTLAHTKELEFGYSEKTIITQKQLMVQPNAPRFLREGDRMELSAKIVNLTDSEMTGQVSLQLTDPTTNQSVDGWWSNRQPNQYFTVGARQSVSVGFSIDIPYQYNRPLTYRFVANAHNYSDGEEATLPVVSNRMLVTESLPLNISGNGSRSFKWDKLLQSGASETLNHHALTVEFTSNPAWYAVQALPYLMEYPYECAEQTFNRFYSNALASTIANSTPRIREIFEKWKTADTAALLSNLQKDQELKSVLLEETPWVLEAKNESQQKKKLALLFDNARMEKELASALTKLQEMQLPNGGFVWFKGGPDDRYITQYILTGIGHLQKLKALPSSAVDKIHAIVLAALPYLDKKIKEDYAHLPTPAKTATAKAGLAKPGAYIPGNIQAQYLYMRSFFNEQGIPGDVFPAVNYYRKQAQQSWLQTNKFQQGMIALALYRTGDPKTAKDILASLKQNAIRDAEKGMYWKDPGGYYWYQSPIETQSLLIEAFQEIDPNAAIDKELKTWLLQQKQTRNWPTTRATADACYALLSGSTGFLGEEKKIEIRLGDKLVSTSAQAISPISVEAGTGYFKKSFDGPFVNPSMGNITVTMSGPGSAPGSSSGSPAWGAVYWQYFDNLDKIVPPGTGAAALRLNKKLFVEKNTDRGPVLEPIQENGFLQVGDKIKVRIELKVDRDLEYVHMKDMRASCMEPVNVLSGYKWQGGLGYYESTRDAATDFFFSWLPKGTYVFEYPLFVGQAGNFSNGVTSIQCMYAPEFSFHSEGIRVNVEEHHAN